MIIEFLLKLFSSLFLREFPRKHTRPLLHDFTGISIVSRKYRSKYRQFNILLTQINFSWLMAIDRSISTWWYGIFDRRKRFILQINSLQLRIIHFLGQKNIRKTVFKPLFSWFSVNYFLECVVLKVYYYVNFYVNYFQVYFYVKYFQLYSYVNLQLNFYLNLYGYFHPERLLLFK